MSPAASQKLPPKDDSTEAQAAPLPDPFHAQAMLDALPEATLLLDRTGVIRAANAAAEPLLRQARARLIDRPLSAWVQEVVPFDALLHRAWRDGAALREQSLTLLPRHRPPIAVVLDLLPVLEVDESQSGLIARLRAAAPQTANAPGGAAYMAAVLAHEIKNPLAGIRGAAQLLAPHLDSGMEKMASLIMAEVDRIRALVTQMEQLGEPARARSESVNIHEALRHATLLIAANAPEHLMLAERYDPSLPPVAAQRDGLIQIVLNLCKNAIEAMGESEDATLTLTTDYYRDGPNGGGIRLRIADTGPGIPEELQPSIFEPFVTTKSGGKGLGLAIVAKLAADMGARLALAESYPGHTCFELLLPVWRD